MQDREKVDTDKRVTFVDTENSFAVNGVIDTIELYAAENTIGSIVRVGIYAMMEGDCQFRMLQMVRLVISQTGSQQVGVYLLLINCSTLISFNVGVLIAEIRLIILRSSINYHQQVLTTYNMFSF